MMQFLRSSLHRGGRQLAAALLLTILLSSCSRPGAVPPNPPSAFDEGLVHWKQGEFDAAIASLTLAIERDPKDAAAVLARGEVYYDQNNLELAIADFTRVLRSTRTALKPSAGGDAPFRRRVRWKRPWPT